MKKLNFIYSSLAIFLVATLMVSCTNDDNNYLSQGGEGVAENDMMYKVPVKDNFVTLVMNGKDTVAYTTEEILIPLAKGSTVTKESTAGNKAISVGNDIIKADSVGTYTVSFDSITSAVKAILNGSASMVNYWQAVAFDLPSSDTVNYDYNDLIIHAKFFLQHSTYPLNKTTLNIAIQPIAYAPEEATNMQLGFVDPAGKKYFLTKNSTDKKDVPEDCEALFKNSKNIDPSNLTTYKFNKYELITYTTKDMDKLLNSFNNGEGISWFVKIDNNYYYASNKPNELESTNDGIENYCTQIGTPALNYPYGLAISENNGTFKSYPLQNIAIKNVYTDFESWLDGSNTLQDVLSNISNQYANKTCMTPSEPNGGGSLWAEKDNFNEDIIPLTY